MSAATGAPVPLVALTRLDPELRDELRRAFDEIVATGAYTLGEELQRFEAEFAAHCGSRNALARATARTPSGSPWRRSAPVPGGK